MFSHFPIESATGKVGIAIPYSYRVQITIYKEGSSSLNINVPIIFHI